MALAAIQYTLGNRVVTVDPKVKRGTVLIFDGRWIRIRVQGKKEQLLSPVGVVMTLETSPDSSH